MESGSNEEQLERNKVADQVKKIRKLEREGGALEHWDRDMYEYVDKLEGLSRFLNYVRGIKDHNVVLDIGSGTKKGITQIANSKMGKDLEFVGTVLTEMPGSVEDASPVNILRAPVETLKGVGDGSVGGVVAVASVAYSASPELAVKSIDRVLADNGAFKGFFKPVNRENENSRQYNLKSHNQFTNSFRELGYDVAVIETRDGQPSDEHVFVAIKPGDSQPDGGAEELLKRDSGMMDKLMISEGHY